MDSFMIRMAGLSIQVNAHYPYLRSLCGDYITEDSVSLDFSVTASEESVSMERTRADGRVVPEYAESLCVYRAIAELLPENDRLVFHGAAISYKNRAYLFAAPSGTGKTTHIRLWRKHLGETVDIINGDKPILWFRDSEIEVCGTPWAGKEGWQKNCHYPLQAICFVERGEKNAMVPISASDGLNALMQQIYIPSQAEAVGKTLELADRLVKSTSFYRLTCDISEEAVNVSFETMTGDKYPN